MIEELSATADLEDSRSFSGAAMAKDRSCIWAVRCKLKDRGFFHWLVPLLLQYFSNPWFTARLYLADIIPLNVVDNSHSDSITWKIGGAIKLICLYKHIYISLPLRLSKPNLQYII